MRLCQNQIYFNHSWTGRISCEFYIEQVGTIPIIGNGLDFPPGADVINTF